MRFNFLYKVYPLALFTLFSNCKMHVILSIFNFFFLICLNSVFSDSRWRIAKRSFVWIEPCRDFVLSHGRRTSTVRGWSSKIPFAELPDSGRGIDQYWRYKPWGDLSTGPHVLAFRFVFSLLGRSLSRVWLVNIVLQLINSVISQVTNELHPGWTRPNPSSCSSLFVRISWCSEPSQRALSCGMTFVRPGWYFLCLKK